MQCGAQSCRRAIVRSAKAQPSLVWIGDDLLDAAFKRFARSVEQSQRRYGSHTPGPLECRRRLEKRRMGAVSAPVAGNNNKRNWFGFLDLDALFRPRARDDNWTWKPPSIDIKTNVKEHDRKDDHQAANRVELLKKLDECDSVESIRTALGSTILSAQDFNLLSTNAFNQLLLSVSQQWSADRGLDLEDVGELLYFLQSELEDTSSRNFENFIRALNGKSMTENALAHLVAITQDKIQLGTLNVYAVPYILSILPGIKCNSTTRDTQFVGLVDSLRTYMSKVDLGDIVNSERLQLFVRNFPMPAARSLSATSPGYCSVSLMIRLSGISSQATVGTAQTCADYLAVWAQSSKGPDSVGLKTSTVARWLSEQEDILEVQKSALLQSTVKIASRCKDDASLMQGLSRWLAILRDSFARRPFLSQSFWDAVYPALAANLRPHQLADHFKSFNDNTNVVRVLVSHWYIPEAFENMHMVEPHRNADEFASAVKDTLEKRVSAHHDHQTPIYQPFIAALDTLIEHTGLVDYKLVEEIFSLFDHFNNAKHVTATFNRLVDRGHRVEMSQLSSETSSLLINHFVNKSKLNVATRIFLNCPAATLEHNRPLFLAHLDTPAPHTGLLFAMLNRAYSENSVPKVFRPVRQNPLATEFVALINTMAFALARAPGLTARQAYRAVWQCYRYQRDRDVEPNWAWSRALVHAGITRYLREGLWFSTPRLVFILRWVRTIDGDEVADRLAAFAERHIEKMRADQQRARYESSGAIQVRGFEFKNSIVPFLEDEAAEAAMRDKIIRKRILRLWRKNKPWLKKPVGRIESTDAGK